MNLKPQDIVFLLKLVAIAKNPWSFNSLAADLRMSPSEVHAAAKRAVAAGLASKSGSDIKPNLRNLSEFLEHGIQYVFVPERGAMEIGMPTSCAAPPLNAHFAGGFSAPPVWPDPEGSVRGEAFSPLYKSVPHAARKDSVLYELLVLVDAIRGGSQGERELAKKELKQLLNPERVASVNVKSKQKKSLVIGGEIEVSRVDLRQLAQQFYIKRLSVFGSAARGELKPGSDIDLLVEFDPNNMPSLGRMVEVHDAFEKLFKGFKVDLATPAILNNPYRRKSIEKDLETLYAA